MPSVRRSTIRLLVALTGASVGLAFAGCQQPGATPAHPAEYPDHPNDNPAITAAPSTEESHAFTGSAGDQIGDDYVYYPTWQVYYSQAHKEYVYYNGRMWVRTAKPDPTWAPGIEQAPSVPMTFHDSPEYHHADVARQYPRTWRPAEMTGEPARTTNDDVREGKTTQ